jgi:hypothetical protein
MHQYKPGEKNRVPLWIYPLFIIISALYLLVYSGSTSPLFSFRGVDSGIFALMGKLLLEGKTPYVDFFDHKGPVLIFIEALGLAPFGGRHIGLFVLQIINLTIIQTLIFTIAGKFISLLNSITVVFLCLMIFTLSIGEGNLTEEYSLSFTLISLLFTIQYFLSDKKEISLWKMGIIGIGIACLFWMRMNNMGVICACILYILGDALQRKNLKVVQKLVAGTLAGFLAVSVPLVLYFVYKDAFHEMIYATFVFNMKYAGYEPELSFPLRAIFIYVIKYWSVFIILITGTLLYCRRKKEWSLLLLVFLLVVFGLVTTRFGLYVPHYMTLNIPLLALGLALIIKASGSFFSKRIIAWGSLAACIFLLSGYTVWKYNNAIYRSSLDDSAFISRSSDIVRQIPGSEKDSVYTYNVQARFLLNTGVEPYYRYFIFQEWHGVHDKQIYDDINKMMETHPPLWIVLPAQDTEEQGYTRKNTSFYKILDKNYSLFYKNDDFLLYKRN